MENQKWISTIASIWVQCSSGASYAFGIYSPVIKSSQGYDQSTLDTLSVFKDIGANAGVLSGLLYSASGRPWIVHLAGAVQCFAGYLLMWLSVTGVISRPPVPLMCFYMLMAAQAQTFFNTGNVVTSVQNFPDYGGTIVGIMKGFLGLSGAVLIQAYRAFLKGNPSSFILMLALLPSLNAVLLMCLVRVYRSNSRSEKKYLNGFSLLSLILAAYLMILIIMENISTLPSWSQVTTFILLLVLLVSFPFKIAMNAQKESLSPEEHPLMDGSDSLESNKFISREDPKTVSEDLNLIQAMCTLNFWLLFIAIACGMGSGLATINNISQIGESLGYNVVQISTLVSLYSIWNFLGRLGGGYVSDIFLHSRGWARPLFMVVTLATMTIGHVIIALGFSWNLYLGTIIIGVCYGSQWSLMPTITSEIFGVAHMGTIFNTISIASPIGSYILSVRIIGYIYDKQAYGEGKTLCVGTRCFMLSFFIMASVTLCGSLVALALFFRTKEFYRLVVLRRLRRVQNG